MGRLFNIWHAIWRHKSVVTTLLFLALLTFVDDDSFVIRYQRRAVIGHLHEEIDKYAAMYESETRQLEALQNDPETVERVARERYLMKRPNEDIYVFEPTSDQQ